MTKNLGERDSVIEVGVCGALNYLGEIEERTLEFINYKLLSRLSHVSQRCTVISFST